VGSLHASILALEFLRCVLDILELCGLLTTGVSPSWSGHLLQGVPIYFRLQKLDRPYMVILLFKRGVVEHYIPLVIAVVIEGIALCIFDAFITIPMWGQNDSL
jgi:hypothetical protein